MKKAKIFNLIIAFLIFAIGHFGCSQNKNKEASVSHIIKEDTKMKKAPSETDDILVPNPPLSLDFYPCSDCHIDLDLNTQRRELVEMHDDIVFDHDSENRWCLACHDADNRDSLRLASGKLLSFKKSYKLCGQCHGPKYRDWKLGIHGKRTGEWNGTKQYLLCVHCHDPHSPKFKMLKPLPPPAKPSQFQLDSIN